MATEKFDLSVILRFIDKSAQGLKGFQANMSKVGKKMQNVGKTMSVAVTAPIVALGVNAVRIGADYQRAMNMVGAVTGATGKKFGELNAVAQDLGSTTQFSARQAAEAMKFMGMAGFNTNKIIAASPKVLELAAAAQLDMASAADLTTNIMSGFGFQAKDMARVNDVLVNTFTNANVSLPQMGEAMKKIGPVASKMKFRFTEVSAALGLMGNAGIQGSEAGVAMRRALINLQKPTKQQQQAMRFMELEFKNADGTMKDLTGIVGEYEKAAKKGASETQVMTSMMQIFGPRAVAPMLALLSAGSKGLAEMEEKTKKQGTASEIARRQMEGLPGALKLVSSAWEGVNIALTSGAFGKWVEDTGRGLAEILGSIAKFIKTHPEITKWGVIVAGIFAVGGPLLIGLGLAAAAIGAITLPIAAGALATAGIVALAAVAISKWDDVKKKLIEVGVLEKKLPGVDLGAGKTAKFRDAEAAFARKTQVDREEFAKQHIGRGTGKDPLLQALISGAVGAGKGVVSGATSADAFLAGILGVAPGIGANQKTEIIVKVESEPGTSAKVVGVKGDKVKVENTASIGPTLAGVGGF